MAEKKKAATSGGAIGAAARVMQLYVAEDMPRFAKNSARYQQHELTPQGALIKKE